MSSGDEVLDVRPWWLVRALAVLAALVLVAGGLVVAVPPRVVAGHGAISVPRSAPDGAYPYSTLRGHYLR